MSTALGRVPFTRNSSINIDAFVFLVPERVACLFYPTQLFQHIWSARLISDVQLISIVIMSITFEAHSEAAGLVESHRL